MGVVFPTGLRSVGRGMGDPLCDSAATSPLATFSLSVCSSPFSGRFSRLKAKPRTHSPRTRRPNSATGPHGVGLVGFGHIEPSSQSVVNIAPAHCPVRCIVEPDTGSSDSRSSSRAVRDVLDLVGSHAGHENGHAVFAGQCHCAWRTPRAAARN